MYLASIDQAFDLHEFGRDPMAISCGTKYFQANHSHWHAQTGLLSQGFYEEDTPRLVHPILCVNLIVLDQCGIIFSSKSANSTVILRGTRAPYLLLRTLSIAMEKVEL